MGKPRARDLGIPFEGTPGAMNAITVRDDEFEYAPHAEKMTMPTFLNDVVRQSSFVV